MNTHRMKSLLTAVVAMLLLTFAPNCSQAQFTIGIKVAANADNYIALTTINIGMEAGVFIRLGDRLFFQPEVNYAFKNSTFREDANVFSTNAVLKQHYIAVPALLGYHFINKDNFKFRLIGGPRFDFRVADNMDGTSWHTNPVQWGGQIGLGIDFWLFTLDASYCFAGDNFRNSTEGVSQTKHMNMILLSFGMKFIK